MNRKANVFLREGSRHPGGQAGRGTGGVSALPGRDSALIDHPIPRLGIWAEDVKGEENVT